MEAAKPEKIVLLGSAARGEMGPDSDLDLLVIKRGKFNRDRVTVTIYYTRARQGAPVDIVVVTPEEVELYRDTHCLVICPALKEGIVVYEAKRLPPDDPQEWLNRARSNLARAMSHIPEAYLEDLCFDAQQCVEKAIKGVFMGRGESFPFIHDLEELLSLLHRNGLKIPKYIFEAEELSQYAAKTRYPGVADPVTLCQYRRGGSHCDGGAVLGRATNWTALTWPETARS